MIMGIEHLRESVNAFSPRDLRNYKSGFDQHKGKIFTMK
jgi:hypothetical protein